MAITTLDTLLTASKQKVRWKKPSATCVAGQWHTTFNLLGDPSIGSFSWINNQPNGSINGCVIDDSRSGFPSIIPFGTNNKGYLTGFSLSNTLAGRFMIYDRVWEAGQFFINNASSGKMYNLITDASTYEYRVPLTSTGKRDWSQLEMWMDVSSLFPIMTINIALNYINQDGNASTTPTSPTLSAYITGRNYQFNLQPGDKGVQRITDISIGSNIDASYGSFQVYLARSLYTNTRININSINYDSFIPLSMAQIDASAAIALNFAADSVATGVLDCILEIKNG